MTPDPTFLTSQTSTSHSHVIHTADGSTMPISHIGTISQSQFSMPHIYLVPNLSLNLLSVGQLTELGLTITFSSNGCVLQDPQAGQIIGTGRKIGRLFELSSLHLPTTTVSATSTLSKTPTFELWHSRLGHASLSRVKTLASTAASHSSAQSEVPASAPTTHLRPHSTRVRNPPAHLSDFHCYHALATLHAPHNFHEASSNPIWQHAMEEELGALSQTRTWDLVDLPLRKSAVGCKWVYMIKTRSDGFVERYKA
ncbi:uncharacterized protein LOC132281721 [Cornus florida]|uniref:uncharacterized protein LOC132281721 n=1 Tax=Cornus florida TaxID=4283 RepID=UPI00289E39A4|nr:uncharacterized protein LOC132281721 [Cornus florida]